MNDMTYYIVELPIKTNLKKVEEWLNEEVGDSEDVINVEIVDNYYVYVYHWMWLQKYKNLNNLLPSWRVGFYREEDATLCKLIWG